MTPMDGSTNRHTADEDTRTHHPRGEQEPEHAKQERLRLSVALMQKMYQRATGGSVKKMATAMNVDWRAVNDILHGKRYPQPDMAYAFITACSKLVGTSAREGLPSQEHGEASLDVHQEADISQESTLLLHALGYTTLVENREALDTIRAMHLPDPPTT